ncbi:hypothetical protein RJ641_023648 [Dillenia turbinata]|uniref:Uncharacterized protein n=1 Tax=Dillenia turbinata TaxID=194707 RepID=A0AAN8UA05_9MAGN
MASECRHLSKIVEFLSQLRMKRKNIISRDAVYLKETNDDRVRKIPCMTRGVGNLRNASPSVRRSSLSISKGMLPSKLSSNGPLGSLIPPSYRFITSLKLSNSSGVLSNSDLSSGTRTCWVGDRFFLFEDKGILKILQGPGGHTPHPYQGHPNHCSNHSHKPCPILVSLLLHFLSDSLARPLCTSAVALAYCLEGMSTKRVYVNLPKFQCELNKAVYWWCKYQHPEYLISKENAVIVVILGRINPRIADKVNSAMARNILKRDRLEVEFTMVKISDNKSSRESNLFIPIKCDSECRISCN